jgi:hypothetical protein
VSKVKSEGWKVRVMVVWLLVVVAWILPWLGSVWRESVVVVRVKMMMARMVNLVVVR